MKKIISTILLFAVTLGLATGCQQTLSKECRDWYDADTKVWKEKREQLLSYLKEKNPPRYMYIGSTGEYRGVDVQEKFNACPFSDEQKQEYKKLKSYLTDLELLQKKSDNLDEYIKTFEELKKKYADELK